jgi:hypothetical protein
MKRSIFIVFTFLSSCVSHDTGFFEFDPRSLKESPVALTSICDSVYYIPLDNAITLDLIHDNLIYSGGLFYISSKDIGILKYDKKGRFVGKIGNKGRGPGEYTFHHDFAVDRNNNTIYVHDRSDLIKVYSRSGNHIRNMPLHQTGAFIDKIAFHNSNLFAFQTLQMKGSFYNWIIYDTLGNITGRKSKTIPSFYCGFSGGCGTYEFNNKLYYWNIYNDSVFTIAPDLSYKTSFILKPGEHRLPYSNFDPSALKEYLHIWKIFETQVYYTILYTYKQGIFVLVDKESGETYQIKLDSEKGIPGEFFKGGIINDFDNGMPFLPKAYYEEDGREYMLGLVYPFQIKALVSSDKFITTTTQYPEKQKDLKNMADSLKETDNPVLMVVRLKNNHYEKA